MQGGRRAARSARGAEDRACGKLLLLRAWKTRSRPTAASQAASSERAPKAGREHVRIRKEAQSQVEKPIHLGLGALREGGVDPEG